MAYENYESVLIKGFGEELSTGKILRENIDLTSSKPRRNYEQYISKVSAFQPREFKIDRFPKMGLDRVVDMSTSIIVAIFGEKVLPILEDYYKVLYQAETTDPLEGISLIAVNTITNEKTEIVEVPSMEYSSTITTIVHEFSHYLLRNLNIDFAKKRYYEEIISIYAEKISNLYISMELGLEGNRFLQQIEECRLEGINWHYNTNLPAMEMMLLEYRKLKQASKTNIFMACKLAEIENSLPILKQANGESILKAYYKNLADSYGIGYLFAETLYQKHLDDYRTLGIQIRKLLEKEQTLQDLLNYYGINTRNPEVYRNVDEKIQELRKVR